MRQTQIAVFKAVLLAIILTFFSSGYVLAQTSKSSNYGVTEAQFGTGAGNTASGAYQAQGSVGSLGVGNSASTNFRAASGFLTPSDPYLELIVNAASIDLGVLSTGSTATGTGTFSVRTYLSGTYVVQTISNPPTSEGGAVLASLASPTAPAAGTEQFGINLVANTVPATFGANSVNIPDNTFADGEASPGYNTANVYKYVVGNTIAHSPKTVGNQGIGRTDYTISYIANTGPLTKAGLYTMAHTIVVVATF